MNDKQLVFEIYLVRTIPKIKDNSSSLRALSQAKVDSIKSTATISVERLPEQYIIKAKCPNYNTIAMVAFDKSGNLATNDIFDIGKAMKTCIYGVTIYIEHDYSVGIYIVDDKMAVVNNCVPLVALFKKNEVVYISDYQPLDRYFNGWVTGYKGSQLVDNRVFFVTNNGYAISMSIDETGGSRYACRETVHHTLHNLIELWADRDCIYCLSRAGDLDFVHYNIKASQVVKTTELKAAAFPEGKEFSLDSHEAVSIAGSSDYIAVATFTNADYINIVWLLDRKGKLMSSAADVDKGGVSFNVFHRMEFCQANKCGYLLAQSLFNFVSLFLINPKARPEIHFIRKVLGRDGGISWSLLAIPGKRDWLISCCNTMKADLLKITLNYDPEDNERKIEKLNKKLNGEDDENEQQSDNNE